MPKSFNSNSKPVPVAAVSIHNSNRGKEIASTNNSTGTMVSAITMGEAQKHRLLELGEKSKVPAK
jgi:hypothetical protein